MEIRKFLMVLWKWWWLFLGTTITVLVSTTIFTFTQTPTYEAKIRLIVSPSEIFLSDISNLRSAVTALDTPVVANTYAEISQSPSIVEKAWEQLDILFLDEYEVFSTVLQETTIVEILVSGPDPVLCQNLASAVTDQTLLYVEGLTTVYDLTLLDPATVPEAPTKPNYLFNLALGLAIGLMAGVLLATMAEYLTLPVANKEDSN